MPNFEIGGVYKLGKDYSSRSDGKDAKERWFIYLGNSPYSDAPVFVYITTTTTQLRHFAAGGDQADSNFICFNQDQYGFERKCIACLDNLDTDMTVEQFESFLPDKRGQIDVPKLKEIYAKILISKHIPKKIKQDIHSSFNNAGITGLKNP